MFMWLMFQKYNLSCIIKSIVSESVNPKRRYRKIKGESMARGRKVNSNGERSKQLLLEKAIELFAANGYHQTKISDIVKAASLTQPTFYLYFESKDSLFNSLNAEFNEKLMTIFDTDVEGNVSLSDLQKKLENVFTFFAQNPLLTKVGFFEAMDADVVKAELAQHLQSSIIGLQGIEHSKIVAEALVGAVERLTLTCLLTGEFTPKEVTESLMSIYFSAAHQTA